jgi:acylphosphatase
VNVVVRGRATGKVQGVWFRRHVAEAAVPLAVRGYARNLDDGSVEVLLVGTSDAVAELQARVASGSPRSRVDSITWQAVDELSDHYSDFLIL